MTSDRLEAGARATPAPLDRLFRREGDVWTIAYEGRVVHLKDAKGLHDLARLLSRPGERFHVSDLLSGSEAPADRPEDAAETERARKAVGNRIRLSIDRIRALDEELGLHLGNAVRIGTVCMYRPERPITWATGDDADVASLQRK